MILNSLQVKNCAMAFGINDIYPNDTHVILNTKIPL